MSPLYNVWFYLRFQQLFLSLKKKSYMDKFFETSRVFGVSNDEVYTYIEREKVDTLFLEGLTKNKHIIIYGSSKQGKTALTNKHLCPNQYVRVNCSSRTTVIDLYRSVLRQSNIEYEESRIQTTTIGGDERLEVKAKIKIPYIADVEGGSSIGANDTVTSSKCYKTVEYNLELAQDVSELLRSVKFDKRIIIENFHYLEDDVQRQLATDLRVFEDYNILFIIIGIWRERNRLSQYNGDLQDRVIEIPVEPWEKSDLLRILEKGQSALNVSFALIQDDLLQACFDSVGVFQELCKEICIASGVLKTQSQLIEFTKDHLHTAIEKKLSDYSGRHIRSLEALAEQKVKSSSETPLYIPYYFIQVIFKQPFDDIVSGIKRRTLHEKIRELHHRKADVRSSDIGYFLTNLVESQHKKRITPPIFDYDVITSSVKIIDSTFYFFLQNCDRDEILEELPIPTDLRDSK